MLVTSNILLNYLYSYFKANFNSEKRTLTFSFSFFLKHSVPPAYYFLINFAGIMIFYICTVLYNTEPKLILKSILTLNETSNWYRGRLHWHFKVLSLLSWNDFYLQGCCSQSVLILISHSFPLNCIIFPANEPQSWWNLHLNMFKVWDA